MKSICCALPFFIFAFFLISPSAARTGGFTALMDEGARSDSFELRAASQEGLGLALNRKPYENISCAMFCAVPGGFTTRLYHRDSIFSDPVVSKTERHLRSIACDIARFRSFDSSSVRADLRGENIERVALAASIFGCGIDSKGVFTVNESMLGPESLVSRVHSGKFSYYLPQIHKSGFINFGENAVVSGTGVVTIPLITKGLYNNYFLTLKGFTVNGEKVEFIGFNYGKKEGNMLIDSGTKLVYLPPDVYNKFEDVVRSHISAKPLRNPVPGYNLCYRSLEFSPPTITANFEGGELKLKSYNTFQSIGWATCLAFAPEHHSTFGIYGSVAQTNFLIGYDLAGKTVSFKST